MQKHKPISGFEQEMVNMEIKRKNKAKLTPLAGGLMNLVKQFGTEGEAANNGWYWRAA